ncbi:MAG: DinB family protein [Deltaproteobacteria bacterium]|nr:DinB family protein [Deltaproteobacteria bacterium]
MTSQEAKKLAQLIRRQVEEMSRLCAGLDEATASRSPEGRWTPKMILSHLCGPEGVGAPSALQVILQQETPLIEVEAANPYYTGNRPAMTLAELLLEFKGQYGQMADLVETLSDTQLARKAQVPLFKDSPIGEYPTLHMFILALAEYHLNEHITHMKEVLKALGFAPST